MTCDEARDQLDAYILDELTSAERTTLEAHLAVCAECRAQLTEIEETLARLPLALAAATGVRPTPAVRERLLQSIAAGPAQPPAPARARRTSWTQRQWWNLPRVAVLVIAVALVASLGWSFRLNQALSEERQLREAIAGLVGQQEVVLEIVDGQDTVRHVLRPTTPGSTAYGKVFTRPEFSETVVMAARLPEAPEGDAYHVWLTQAGELEHVGVLDVNDDGFGLLIYDADLAGPEYEAAQVSLQPLDDELPRAPPVLVWEQE